MAVSSRQHQHANVPPASNIAGTSHPDSGVSVGINGNGLSAADNEDITSALRQQAAPAGLEHVDPTADAAEAAKIKTETPAVASAPSVELEVEALSAESTKTARSSEPSPAAVDEYSALAESKSLGDRDAALASSASRSGISSVAGKENPKVKELKKTKTTTHVSAQAGPWAFAAAAADSEYSGGARVGASMVRDFRLLPRDLLCNNSTYILLCVQGSLPNQGGCNLS